METRVPTVMLSGVRTPIGKLSGALGSLRASDLGAIAIRGALDRAGIAPDAVDRVVLGQVLLAGAGQNPARQAAIAAGLPLDVPAVTINKVCLSGLHAIHLGDLLVRSREAKIVVAGGMESMTNAPHLVPGARGGFRYGDGHLRDAILTDGLMCALEERAMGEATEADAVRAGITRDRQDAIAMTSHARAAAAAEKGTFATEILPVSVPRRRAAPVVVDVDEGVIPDTNLEALGRLRPAFAEDGTITAGNASQLSDGAAAVVICSADTAFALGVEPLAEIVAHAEVAGPDTSLLTQPSRAAAAALLSARLEVSELDLFEINEAFAAVVGASMDDLGITSEICNVNGGAIALGHPLGMSGARIALTLAHELRRRGTGRGVAALCGGGGQGEALVLRALG